MALDYQQMWKDEMELRIELQRTLTEIGYAHLAYPGEEEELIRFEIWSLVDDIFVQTQSTRHPDARPLLSGIFYDDYQALGFRCDEHGSEVVGIRITVLKDIRDFEIKMIRSEQVTEFRRIKCEQIKKEQ